MTDLVRIGSETAKGGFANEKVVAKKFDYKQSYNFLLLYNFELSKQNILGNRLYKITEHSGNQEVGRKINTS